MGYFSDERQEGRLSRRKVTFSDYDDVREIKHIRYFSTKEVRATYFSRKELENIQLECLDILEQANTERKPGDGVYLRGLDQHTLKYKQMQTESIRHVRDTVFEIQQFQRSSGVDASQIMAELYAKYSAPSVAAAHIAAVADLFAAFKGSFADRSRPIIRNLPSEKQKGHALAMVQTAVP